MPLEKLLLDPFRDKRKLVVWLCNAVRIHNKKEKATVTLSLGICQATNRVAFIALDTGQSALMPFAVRDVYIDKNSWCEEQRRCLDFKCPRNKSCYSSWLRAHRSWAPRAFPRKKNFDRFMRIISNAEEFLQPTIQQLDWSKMGIMEVFQQAPLKVTVKKR